MKPLLEVNALLTMMNSRVRKKVYLLKSSLCLNLNALLLCWRAFGGEKQKNTIYHSINDTNQSDLFRYFNHS